MVWHLQCHPLRRCGPVGLEGGKKLLLGAKKESATPQGLSMHAIGNVPQSLPSRRLWRFSQKLAALSEEVA